MRGTERVHQKFPLRFKLLLIVTRMGRDYTPGPRQRIEQVARQGSSYRCAAITRLARSLRKTQSPMIPTNRLQLPSRTFEGTK